MMRCVSKFVSVRYPELKQKHNFKNNSKKTFLFCSYIGRSNFTKSDNNGNDRSFFSNLDFKKK